MSAGVGETGKLDEIGMELGALIDRHAGVLLLLLLRLLRLCLQGSSRDKPRERMARCHEGIVG